MIVLLLIEDVIERLEKLVRHQKERMLANELVSCIKDLNLIKDGIKDGLKAYSISEAHVSKESKELVEELIEEAELDEQNVTANITGYQVPLGSNPSDTSRENNAKDPYRGHRSKRDKPRDDSDEKIRNSGSENSTPYIKRHPLDHAKTYP